MYFQIKTNDKLQMSQNFQNLQIEIMWASMEAREASIAQENNISG